VKVDLPAFAAPRELELVEALPRTLLGKVERKAL
jgi:acyl-coenzyme A synthetase/AMP-(fatty) acid ligase